MKPYIANLLNSIALILLGGWGYLSSDTPSVTALIPVFAGILLLVITPWFKKGNKIIVHVAVTITFLLLIALFKPLNGAFARDDQGSVLRVIGMMLTSLLSLIIFIVSFVNARIIKK
jgi:hypothetical protein